MAAPLGNDYAKGHGRPRRLDVEVARLAAAAQHARALLESQALVAVLTDDVEVRENLERRLGEGVDRVLEIEAQVERLKWLAAEVEAAVPATRKGRKRRKAGKTLGASAHDAWVSQAAVALDRMADHLGLAQ